MYKGKFVSIIIAAAGMSNRMGSKINKQFLLIDNKPILAHSIEAFNGLNFVDEIIVVSKEGEVEYCKKEIILRYGFNKVTKIVKGGKERQDSIYNGILALNKKIKEIRILLVYHKNDIGDKNETAAWKKMIRDNYSSYDFCK